MLIGKVARRIAHYVKLLGYGKVEYLRREGVRIGSRCEILTSVENFGSEPWLISIGDDVTVTDGVKFLTHDASTRLFRRKYAVLNADFGNKFGPITVRNNSFIGVNSIILPGVTIHGNCVVGAGSVVNKDVPENTVVAGNPAKVLMSMAEFEERCLKKYVPLAAKNRVELKAELLDFFQVN
ncbi:MAG: acyltransferase [Burkholderiaceae bacterium]